MYFLYRVFLNVHVTFLQTILQVNKLLQDPRRSEYHWTQKENEEQAYRYKQLRLNKKKLLSPAQLYSDYMHQVSLVSATKKI